MPDVAIGMQSAASVGDVSAELIEDTPGGHKEQSFPSDNISTSRRPREQAKHGRVRYSLMSWHASEKTQRSAAQNRGRKYFLDMMPLFAALAMCLAYRYYRPQVYLTDDLSYASRGVWQWIRGRRTRADAGGGHAAAVTSAQLRAAASAVLAVVGDDRRGLAAQVQPELTGRTEGDPFGPVPSYEETVNRSHTLIPRELRLQPWHLPPRYEAPPDQG